MSIDAPEASLPVIMLVDDRPENLIALEASLECVDARIVCMDSGNAALHFLLTAQEVALIFLDVQMPEIDGFETAEIIRAREATKSIPIIFVTAISKQNHYIFRGYEAGAVDYLFKPLDSRVVRSKAKIFLDLYNQRLEISNQKVVLRKYERVMMKQRHDASAAQFISGIAHNFNNILAGVRGYGQLMQMHPDNTAMAEKSGTQIMEGVDKLSTLVQSLRSLVVGDESQAQTYSIEGELLRSVEAIRPSLSSRISFNVSTMPAGYIHVSRGAFHRAFSAVTVNALEAVSTSEAPVILVDTQVVEGVMVLSISDNGRGMSAEVAEKSVMPLFSTKDTVGVGLGLSQAVAFAEDSGGGLEIDSTLGEGTTVTITVPLVTDGENLK